MLRHQILGQVNKGLEIFKQEALEFIKDYPNFDYSENENKIPELYGDLKLTDNQGNIIDTYQIKVLCSPNYPSAFPFVYETAGRIPINVDWHVFSDGHCCICSIPEEAIICNNGITLESFIENQVKPYFFNQKYREMNGFFLNERSHGQRGNIEFFEDLFRTKDFQKIIQYLLFIKSNEEPDRVSKCFCGSGLKYRNCHKQQFRLIKSLPNALVNHFTNILNLYI